MIDVKKAVRAAIESDKTRIAVYGTLTVAALYAFSSVPAIAAEAAAGGEDLEEIVVSGYRKSLQTAQDIKRDSDVVVDSVTAADIGELPDRSVTETLQRIPGVQITRFAAGVDPDHFSVEGSGVTIRGLTYVHSEFNNRDTFTANNGRALSFSDVPAELLGGVDVFKSPSADRIEGGIGGVVNLRTRLPFDSKGLSLAGSLEANYGDFADKHSPSGTIVFSDRWETGIGEIGILGSYSQSEVKSRADKIQISNFAVRGLRPDNSTLDAPDSTGNVPAGDVSIYFPRGAVAGSQEFDRKRKGISAAVQWRSPEQNWEAVAQFIKSDARETWREYTSEIATDVVTGNGDAIARPGTTINYDKNTGIFSDGAITSGTGWRDDQWATWRNANGRTPAYGLQSNNIDRGVNQKYVTDDTSIHLKWKPTADVQLEFDAQHTKSTVDNLDVQMMISSYQDAYISLSGGAGLPQVQFLDATNCIPACSTFARDPNDGVIHNSGYSRYYEMGHKSYLDPYNSFYRSSMDHVEKSDGTQNAFQLDSTIAINNSNWFKSWKVGVRYADRNQTARFSTYNWGVLSEQWGNGGPVWLDDPIVSNNNQPLNGYEAYNFPNFFRGRLGSPFGVEGRLYYKGNPALQYGDYVKYANAIQQTWQPNTGPRNSGWNSLYNRAGVIPGTAFLPGEVNPQDEKNTAAYAMINLAHKMDNGWKLSGNVGIRFTSTKRVAQGGQQFPLPGTAFQTDQECTTAYDKITTDAASTNTTPDYTQQTPFCKLPNGTRQNLRAYQNGAFNASTVSTKFSYALPSINLKLDVGNGWIFRGAYSKGIAAPDFGLTRNYYNVNVTANDFSPKTLNSYLQGTFSVGNPKLKPAEADNFDLTAEWYFSSVGSLTAALFYKKLSNVTVNDTQRLQLTNNGVILDSVVTTPGNAKEVGKIKGVEFGYQQTFDFLPGFWSGFGVNANYTYLQSSGVPQSTLSATDPDVAAGRQTSIDIKTLPLQGLSKNSYNISPFYQKGPWEVRLAYSWRSRFLLTVRDVIVPFQPIINEATGQLDGSVFFSAGSHVKLGLQISNIDNEVTRTSAVLNDRMQTAPRGWYINDTRYTAGIRWTF